jgi:hypothetical protein
VKTIAFRTRFEVFCEFFCGFSKVFKFFDSTDFFMAFCNFFFVYSFIQCFLRGFVEDYYRVLAGI